VAALAGNRGALTRGARQADRPDTVHPVTIRLTIRTAIWRSHVAQIANAVADARPDQGGDHGGDHGGDQGAKGLVPVIKGNGYGFGRPWLAEFAAEFADTVAVGTVHELADLPDSVTPVVLTPTLTPPAELPGRAGPILTVGRAEHIDALRDWGGRVIVKLESPMRRFGGDIGLVATAVAAGLDVAGVSIHPPLAGTEDDHVAAITQRLGEIEPTLPVWVSHLGPDAYATLPATHHYRLRLGTLLWHGDKAALHLDADVLDIRPVTAGDTAGYRLGTIEADGHLVMIGAGTANGVAMIDEGDRSLSPFHFERHRLTLHETPHMHTSMAFVPDGQPLPRIGDHVDLQRPLHMTLVDEYRWI
jgi:alanine racemase